MPIEAPAEAPTPRLDDPKVVATILVYNNPKGLARVIECISLQSYSVAEIVIVDNGQVDSRQRESVDSSASPRLSELKISVVAPVTNLGVGAGHNLAIEHALAEDPDYVWVLEHDTLPDPHCLESLLAVFADEPDSSVGVVLPDLSRNRYERDLGILRSPNRITETDRFTFNAPLFRAAALRDAGNLREDLFVGQEDWEYSSVLRSRGWRILLLNTALGIHPNRGGGRFPVIPTPARHYYTSRNQFLVSSSRSRVRGLVAQLLALPVDAVAYRSLALPLARLRGTLDGIRGIGGRTF